MFTTMVPCLFGRWSETIDPHTNRRVVTESTSGDVWDRGDSDTTIRIKMFALAIFSIPGVCLIRIPCRTVHLFNSGISHAYQHEESCWKAKRVEWLLSGQPISSPALADLALKDRAIYLIAKEIVLLITLPLAALAMTFVALCGICCPTMRQSFAFIEHTWALSYVSGHTAFEDSIHELNYLGPCMQPRRVWHEMHLYRHFATLFPRTAPYGELKHLQYLVASLQSYNCKQLPIQELLTQITEWKKSAPRQLLSHDLDLQFAMQINHLTNYIVNTTNNLDMQAAVANHATGDTTEADPQFSILCTSLTELLAKYPDTPA